MRSEEERFSSPPVARFPPARRRRVAGWDIDLFLPSPSPAGREVSHDRRLDRLAAFVNNPPPFISPPLFRPRGATASSPRPVRKKHFVFFFFFFSPSLPPFSPLSPPAAAKLEVPLRSPRFAEPTMIKTVKAIFSVG